jgi:DNA-binding CsgD family transcriptional regulator
VETRAQKRNERRGEQWRSLTPREQRILERLLEGLPYKQIADVEEISLNTVRTHVKRVYKKLGVQARSQLQAKKDHIKM